jgi:2-iminobutanoate/2-iminopropanoate deaminase
MQKQVVTVPGFEQGLSGRVFSPGLRIGPWLLLSGVVAHDFASGENLGRAEGSTTQPGRADPEAQWRKALSNLQLMVEAAGGTMGDVVRANAFVTDISYYYDYEWVRKEFFVEPYPIATAFEVSRLVHPDWVIEIEALAYIEGNEE